MTTKTAKAVITVGVVGAVGVTIFALSKRAAGVPGISVSKMEVGESGPYDGFYNIIFSAKITNTGSVPQSLQLVWGSNYWAPWYEEEDSRIINLSPGATFSWSTTYTEVYDYYRGYFTCWLYVEGIEVKGVWK